MRRTSISFTFGPGSIIVGLVFTIGGDAIISTIRPSAAGYGGSSTGDVVMRRILRPDRLTAVRRRW